MSPNNSLQPQGSGAATNNPQSIGPTNLQPQGNGVQGSAMAESLSSGRTLRVEGTNATVAPSGKTAQVATPVAARSATPFLYAGIGLIAVLFMAVLAYGLFRERP